MRILLVLFIVMPIVEMVILIKVGSLIGAWYTVGLVLFTAVIGVNLLKAQGLSALMRAQRKAQYGALPVSEIGEGLMLAVAGALLLTPGFVTDAIGFILLTPAFRKQIAQVLARGMVARSAQFTQQSSHTPQQDNSYSTPGYEGSGHNTSKSAAKDNVVIEGEFKEVDDKRSEH